MKDMDITPIQAEMCVCHICGKIKQLGVRLGHRFNFAVVCVCCVGNHEEILTNAKLPKVAKGTYPQQKEKKREAPRIRRALVPYAGSERCPPAV